ncbi:MAG TPA: ABC transporter ATP-binding protein [Propionicimonas sp.]|nr:ABC transporter ATP-binding protein [Propionicimonas sp.]HQA78100.1 ABC transporter ATP-binding protein [Propionicimonas sp.]HQD96453.1 ABC transporter ATP-binding protein [Propionicimonas sp.]
MSGILMRASNVTAVYAADTGKDVPAVDNVTLEVPDGQIVGLAGESGCGKSTLGNALAMIANPPLYVVAGKLEISDTEIDLSTLAKGANEVHRGHRGATVSLLPQGAMNAISPTLRIRDLVVDVMRAHKRDTTKAEALDRATDRLKMLEMPTRVLDSYSHQLSGGMKQRMVTVISTLLNPQLLIADEPTSALDVSSQKALIEMLLAMVEAKIMRGVIFITHDLPVLSMVTDRLAIMYAGKIVEDGPTEELVNNARHPYTSALLSSVLDPTEETRTKHVLGIPGSPPNLGNPPSGCRFHPRCKFAMPACKLEEPAFLHEGEHEVACWWAMEHLNETVPMEVNQA